MRKIQNGRRTGYKNSWLEFWWGGGDFSLKYSLGGYFSRRHELVVCLWLFKAFIKLPWGNGIEDCETPTYGMYYHANSLVLCYGMKQKHIPMPWQMQWVRTSLLLKDQTWAHDTPKNKKSFWKDEWKEKAYSFTEPYTYVLKSGALQHMNAMCFVKEWEWRPLWFKWTSLFKNVRKAIDINFDGEVGERAGSWKGGCTGCSYDINPGETPLQTLRRMQTEREFS